MKNILDTAYSNLSVPAPDTPVHHEDFCALLQTQEHVLKTQEVRVFPTTFTPHTENTSAFGRSSFWQWVSLSSTVQRLNAKGILFRLPLYWQLEPLLFQVCDTNDVFYFLNDIGNMPVGRSAITQNPIDTVITTPEDARLFYDHIHTTKGVQPKHWILIQNLNAPQPIPENITGASVAEEIHVFPGIPLFATCAHSLTTNVKKQIFHLTQGFVVETENDTITVFGTPDDILPLHTYLLPSYIKVTEAQCPCGHASFTFER